MRRTIRFVLVKSAWAAGIAAGLALAVTVRPAIGRQVEAQVRVEGQGDVQVRVEGQGNAQVRVEIRVVGPDGVAVAPTSRPADVDPTLAVEQDKPGGPATFTFTLPKTASGVLAGEPEVTMWFGAVTTVPGSVTKTGCRFTWDVLGARKEAPVLRGTDLRLNWTLAPDATEAQPKPAPIPYTTVAHITISTTGAVAVTEVDTNPVVVPSGFGPGMRPIFAYRYVSATKDLIVTAVRHHNTTATPITVGLKNGRRFAAQPEVKATVGLLAPRPKWNPDRTVTGDSVTWMPPKTLPKKDLQGTIAWTWKATHATTGKETLGTLTLTVKVSPTGHLTILKSESTPKATTRPRPPEAP